MAVDTPGRGKDLIKRKVLKLKLVDKVVLDETDEMLSMGFKDDLISLERTRIRRQTMLSATISRKLKVSKIPSGQKKLAYPKLIQAKNIEHHIYNVSSRNKYEALKRIADLILIYMV